MIDVQHVAELYRKTYVLKHAGDFFSSKIIGKAQFHHSSCYAMMSTQNLFVKNALTKGHLKTNVTQHLDKMPDGGT